MNVTRNGLERVVDEAKGVLVVEGKGQMGLRVVVVESMEGRRWM